MIRSRLRGPSLLVCALAVCASATAGAESPVVRHLPPIPELDAADTATLSRPVIHGTRRAAPYALAWFESMALQSNPALAVALSRVEMARGRYQQVGLPPNPTVGYVASEVGNEETAGQQGGFVGQTFVHGNKLELNQAVECHEIHRRQLEYNVVRQRILTDVRTSFHKILWLQHRTDLLERFLDTNRQAATVAKRLYEAGDNTKADLLLVEIEFEQTSTELAMVEASYEAAWRELSRIVANEGLAPERLDDHLETMLHLTWEDALSRMADHPQLEVIRAELARERSAVARARAEPIPNINAQVSVQYDSGTNHTIAGVQVGFPIPVLDRNQGRIYEATSSVRATMQKLDRTRLSIEKDLAEKFAEYERARRQLDRITSRIVPKAEEVVRITLVAYEAGDLGMADVLNAQRSLLRALLGEQDALRQLRVAFVAIEGFLLSDGMTQ